MTVESIMSRRVVTVEMDDTLDAIRGIFAHVKFHHLLVVEENKLVGVISDRDFLKAVSPFLNTMSEWTRDLATLERRAHGIMSRKPITVTKEATIKKAARLLLEKGVSCLPVTSLDGEIEGIVSWKDILRALFIQEKPT